MSELNIHEEDISLDKELTINEELLDGSELQEERRNWFVRFWIFNWEMIYWIWESIVTLFK